MHHNDDGRPGSAATRPMLHICESWPQKVRVAHFTDLASLQAIDTWVRELGEHDQLQPGVQFTIEDEPGMPAGMLRGVLFDPNEDPLHRWEVLRSGRYLVHRGDKKLELLDEDTLLTRYRYLDRREPVTTGR